MAQESRFRPQRLLEPGRIGTMRVPNRIVMPPMVTEYASDKGFVTDAIRDYYAERARGGAGLVIVEATAVHPRGRGFRHQLCIYDDQFLPGLTQLAGAIKSGGAKSAIQIHHAGMATSSRITGAPPFGPTTTGMRGYEPSEELTSASISEVLEAFGRAARRARDAGFDGVEVHGAHLYLLAQFISRAWNQRQDTYGGPVGNRARFLTEALYAVREAVGQDYPVWCRMNAAEYGLGEAGITLEEAKAVAQMAQEAGANAISVSCFGWGRYAAVNMPSSPGTMLPLSEAIRQVVTVPVMGVGRLDPKVGELALRDGKADFIAIGRALIADAHLPQKAIRGALDDITPCISCYECLRFARDEVGMKCSTNAAVGREAAYRIAPAPQPKKVLVVGGGPAGMEAARIAALRGHQVTLWEKGKALGGLLSLAAKPRHENRFPMLLRFLEKQMKKLRVKVELGKEATAEAILRAQPQAVIIASGASLALPPIPGIQRALLAVDVVAGKPVGDQVVVLGGEKVALRTAQFLAEHGKKVTLVRRGQYFGSHYPPVFRRPLQDYLTDKGVTFLPNAQPQEVTDKGVVVEVGGAKKLLEADTVVVATGATTNLGLFQALQGKVPQVLNAGDSAQPQGLRSAIAAGYKAALEL